MKIGYIYTTASNNRSSVQNKIENQINYLNKVGGNCKGFFLSKDYLEKESYNNIEKYPVKKCKWKYFNIIGQRINTDKVFKDIIRRNNSEFDLFYVRYPGATLGMYLTTKKYGTKIVLEHQSKEIDELKSQYLQNPFGLTPSRFLSWFLYYLYPLINEIIFGKSIRKNCKCSLSVTSEISKYQAKLGAKKTIVVGNGVEVLRFKKREHKGYDLDKLRILYLKGANSNITWSGLDRIIKGIIKYKGKINIELIIAGKIDDELSSYDFIKQIGFISGENLDNIFDNVDIGLNHLALHKINLSESSNLKIREYFARGLPFVYSTIEEDIKNSEFAFKISSDDSEVNINDLIEFSKKILSLKNHSNFMRDFALKNLDFEVKMKKLLKELQILKHE